MFQQGDQIGSYSLLKKLGRGAFGEVWLAEEKTAISAHTFALKLPNEEDVDLEAIRQEADVWEQVKGHPNVLPIIKADIHEGQIYIASEYAPDGSLSEWLKNHGGKAPNFEIAVQMIRGILAGLEHLHSKGVIHRDLKPANILLQADTPRIADFGIARLAKSSSTAGSTLSAGTPSYMAPECFYSVRSEQTDIWAVGVLLHKLLSGKLPFEHPDQVSVMNAILNGEPHVDDSIPAQLREIINKALQKDTALRYKSTREMREDLLRFNAAEELANEITVPDLAAPATTTVVSPVSVVSLPEESIVSLPEEKEEVTIVRPKSEKVYVERVVAPSAGGGGKTLAIGLGIFLVLAAATIWAALRFGGEGDDPASRTTISNSANQSTGNSSFVNGRSGTTSNQSNATGSDQGISPSIMPVVPGGGGTAGNSSVPTSTTEIPPADLSTEPTAAPTPFDIEPDDQIPNVNVRQRTPRQTPTPETDNEDDPPPPTPQPKPSRSQPPTTPSPDTDSPPPTPRPRDTRPPTPRPTAGAAQPDDTPPPPPAVKNSTSN